MNAAAAIFLLLFLGACTSFRHIAFGDSKDEDVNGENIIANGDFTAWPFGASFDFPSGANDADIQIADHWLSFGGGAGIRPAHRISRVYLDQRACVKFEMIDAGRNLNNSCRIYQRVDNWQRLIGADLLVTVDIKTNVGGHVQFVIDAGGAGEATYSGYALGSGDWETLAVRFHVPADASLLWLKIGMTTKDITPGTFFISNARAVVLTAAAR